MSADTLTLHLKKEYFNQIVAGEKTEEYRLATPYWAKRLEDRQYKQVVLLCGYPPASDPRKRVVRHWRGCTRKIITHPHFGPDPVEVFAIRL